MWEDTYVKRHKDLLRHLQLISPGGQKQCTMFGQSMIQDSGLRTQDSDSDSDWHAFWLTDTDANTNTGTQAQTQAQTRIQAT